MKHVIHHNLDIEQSRQIAEKAFAEYQQRFSKYNPTLSWLDARRAQVGFTAKGMSLTGTVELKPGAVEMDLEVPFLLRVFRKPALKVLDDEFRRLIAQHAPSGGQAAAHPQRA